MLSVLAAIIMTQTQFFLIPALIITWVLDIAIFNIAVYAVKVTFKRVRKLLSSYSRFVMTRKCRKNKVICEI